MYYFVRGFFLHLGLSLYVIVSTYFLHKVNIEFCVIAGGCVGSNSKVRVTLIEWFSSTKKSSKLRGFVNSLSQTETNHRNTNDMGTSLTD